MLSRALAATLAPAERFPSDAHLDSEAPLRRAGAFLHRHIPGRFVPAGLDKVLEARLGIDAGPFAAKLAELGPDQAENQRLCGSISLRAVDGADHRLHGAGEVSLPGAAARDFFATAKDEVWAETQAYGGRGERGSADNVGSHSGQLTFTGVWVELKELVGDNETEDGVPEKFEALVGGRAFTGLVEVGRVGERLAKERVRQRPDTEPSDQVVVGRWRSQRTLPPKRTALSGTKKC